MLDPRYVADHLDEVRASLARRSAAAAATLGDDFAETVRARRAAIQEVEGWQKQRNAESEAMAKLDKKSPEFAQKRDELKALSGRIKEGEQRLADLEKKLGDLIAVVPNLPDPSVPEGHDESGNQVVRAWGE